MTKNERLKAARKKAGFTQDALAEKLAAKQPYIAKLESTDNFSLEKAIEIGAILGVDGAEIYYGNESKHNQNITKSPNVPSISANKGVPYYDVDFMGGFDLVFNNQAVQPSFYIDFLPFNDCDCWINVTGKSMGPLIAHGDIVGLKIVEDWKRFLLEGEIYAIITDNGFRTIKMIGAGPDKDHYTLIPYNKSEDYKPQPIPKDVITHVFRVKGNIKKFF